MMEAIWKSLTTRKMIFGSLAVIVLALGGLWLADPDAFPIGPYTAAQPLAPALPIDNGNPPTSEAERIARLQRSIENQRKYLDGLMKEYDNPNGDYKQTEQHFQALDSERSSARRAIRDLKDAGKLSEAAKREAALKDIEARWQNALDRFNLALKTRRTLKDSIAAATQQMHEDQKVLDRLTGTSSPATVTSNANTGPASTRTGSPKPAESSTAPPSLISVPTSPLAVVSAATAPPPASSTPSAGAPANPPADAVSREVERARQEAKLKEEAAKKAENKAQSLTDRIEVLNENITLTKKLLETTRQEADQAQRMKSELEAQLRQKTAEKAPEAELQDLTNRIDLAQERFHKENAEIRSTTDHLHDLQTELSHLQAAQIRALREADAMKQAAEAADEKIAQLQNPFRPRNIVHWLLHHGPRLLLVALGMFVFHRLARAFSRRVVQFMSQGTSKRGTYQDRENRAQTLAGVFNSALSMLVIGGGSLMMLDEVGIPIVPLMGGAAVLGLAVAFGAQNLIKDYFSGFMVLLEDQYGINDVVKIGSISGMVEHISLRTTVLRDLEGIVHFIPHGTITTVSNQTHGWSRALFDVGIDYKEDIDRVMNVLLELGRELRQDPAFASLILDDPEMLGVDNLADSSVVLKFFIKTRPLQQWTVKREMLRRIKMRFDELHIEIPYPHQTVHHRYDTPPPQGQSESPYFPRVA
jgi:small-conductance mechanosensitive channel/predicted  nucleic acid-binding Zn-ribbon protein